MEAGTDLGPQAFWTILSTLGVMLAIVLSAGVLRFQATALLANRRPGDQAPEKGTDLPGSLSWYLLHFSVGGLGLLTVVLLAVMGKLGAEGVSAIVGSIVAYSLGAASGKANSSAQSPRPEAKPQDAAPHHLPAGN